MARLLCFCCGCQTCSHYSKGGASCILSFSLSPAPLVVFFFAEATTKSGAQKAPDFLCQCDLVTEKCFVLLYAETHIPLQRHINPVSKHYDTSNYYSITDRDYLEIISTIKHTASTYERTPGSYKALHEEDLRNTLLATLNATYKGDATGETFRNAGKTDICIERENIPSSVQKRSCSSE